MNKLLSGLMILIAIASTACSASINGGVKTAANDPVTGEMQAKRDLAKARASQETSTLSEPKPSEPQMPTETLFDGKDLLSPPGAGQVLPAGLLLSRGYLGSGAMPQYLSRSCNGRCIAIINETPKWLSVQVGDVIINDVVTQSSRPVMRLASVPLMGNTTVKAGIGLVPPNPSGMRSPTNPGFLAFQVACASAESCPDSVAILLRGYQVALNGEAVPTGECWSGRIRLPSGAWGHTFPVSAYASRPCN